MSSSTSASNRIVQGEISSCLTHLWVNFFPLNLILGFTYVRLVAAYGDLWYWFVVNKIHSLEFLLFVLSLLEFQGAQKIWKYNYQIRHTHMLYQSLLSTAYHKYNAHKNLACTICHRLISFTYSIDWCVCHYCCLTYAINDWASFISHQFFEKLLVVLHLEDYYQPRDIDFHTLLLLWWPYLSKKLERHSFIWIRIKPVNLNLDIVWEW